MNNYYLYNAALFIVSRNHPHQFKLLDFCSKKSLPSMQRIGRPLKSAMTKHSILLLLAFHKSCNPVLFQST